MVNTMSNEEWVEVNKQLPDKNCWVKINNMEDSVWYDVDTGKFKRSPASIISYHSVTRWRYSTPLIQNQKQ